jgi:coenzyme F420-reducing hydrogenase gamma subunit
LDTTKPILNQKNKPKLAVWKFASCDGCQLSLLDCEDELLSVTEELIIANFMEASREVVEGPYDLSLVEGSITTEHDLKRIQKVREQSKFLITIGACATTGGIQALKNFAILDEYIDVVYAKPEYIKSLATSTPISHHVKVDFELRGCPINKMELLEVINAFLNKRKPNISNDSVCVECKQKGLACLTVKDGVACMGPVTHAGCGALCVSYNRGCFGCYGPKENANAKSLGEFMKNNLNLTDQEVLRKFRSFNALAKEFAQESKRHEN